MLRSMLLILTLVAPVHGSAKKEIEAVIRGSWKAYLARDATKYGEFLHPGIRRMSERAPGMRDGRDAVLAALADEWRAFEKKGESVSEKMSFEDLEITVASSDAGRAATAATALYWVDSRGGTRWGYEDQGLVFQAFEKVDDRWLISHQTDAWSLGYDRESEEPGERTFSFDFVQPVRHLDRAVRFYGDFLGEPVGRTAEAAWFDVGGERFVLDLDDLGGRTAPEVGLPSGYVRFHVTDLTATVERLARAKVEIIGGIRPKGPDRCAVALDPAGNIFMLIEENLVATSSATPTAPGGLDRSAPALGLAADAASAWLRMDAAGLAALHREDGSWFDATATKEGGLVAPEDFEKVLPAEHFSRFDRSPAGLAATLDAEGAHVATLGPVQVVSYHRKLTGTGPHAFRRLAHVTHLIEDGKIQLTMMVPDPHSDTLALALDYVGYPQTDLEKAERFYRQNLKLENRYEDDNWYGFWSYGAVFGMYGTDPDEPRLPRAGRTGGYVSFWIKDAKRTHERLVVLGATFPDVAGITQGSGITDEPGYRQIYATDNEGCGVIFTEYTGKAE